MSVYLAWTSHTPPDPDDLVGPWEELREAAPGVLLLESPDSLSSVYHALKWSLPEDAALVVAEISGAPKSRGMAPGTTSWLRARTHRRDAGT